MGLEVVLSSCVTGNKKTKTMPVLISTFKKVIIFFTAVGLCCCMGFL